MRRIDLGGKFMTNYLKELVSFRFLPRQSSPLQAPGLLHCCSAGPLWACLLKTACLLVAPGCQALKHCYGIVACAVSEENRRL